MLRHVPFAHLLRAQTAGAAHLLPARMSARIVELPTLAVAVAIYGGFFVITWWYHSLPVWLAVPVGALLLAWQVRWTGGRWAN